MCHRTAPIPGAPPASRSRRSPTPSSPLVNAFPRQGPRRGRGRLADARAVDRRERLAVHAAPGVEIRLRRSRRKGAARGGRGLRVRRRCRAEDRSRGRRCASARCSRFSRRCRRWICRRSRTSAVVDDGSAVTGEVMNLLARRNLLFQVVQTPSAAISGQHPDRHARIPAKEAADPSAFAQKIRRQLTDERRALRIYGSEVVIGRLTADAGRARLHLINYGGREIEGLRIRAARRLRRRRSPRRRRRTSGAGGSRRDGRRDRVHHSAHRDLRGRRSQDRPLNR